MPKKLSFKCYFGCVIDGPLHSFPIPKSIKWELHQTERFSKWKAVLDQSTIEKGDDYIRNSVRICYRHFEDYFRLPSGVLTKNAIPTLNIAQASQPVEVNITTPSIQEVASSSIPIIQQEQPSTSSAVIDSSSSLSTTYSHKTLAPPAQHPIKKHAKHPKLHIDIKHHMCQQTISKLVQKLEKLSNQYKLQTSKIRAAKCLTMSKSFLKVVETLPENIKTFTMMQLKWGKKPRGRRFTTKEKIMCLSILKQSPKAYNLLKQMFVLPSKRCLQNLLSAFIVQPGINKEILNELKNVAKKLSEEKKLVNLLFDEISLAPGLYYNLSRDEIIGFEDYGYKKTKALADHALVFMIKGIKSKTKQPIFFTYCRSATKKEDLKKLIKIIIKDLHECGLRVITTICDQATTNMSTIKSLQAETKEAYTRLGEDFFSRSFEIEGKKVFPLLDPPHLLKGVRNNLLTKDAIFVQNGKTKCAKWAHIELLFNEDEGADEVRLVNKLTEKHVKKEKIPKMKVKYAAQVFSQRVSAALRFLAKRKVLPAECSDTADFLLLFDKLFDSFNGHSYQPEAKQYKCCFKNNSPHFQLWEESLPVLESIKFISVRNGTIKHEMIPSIKNWIHNIKSFREMWEYLNKFHNVFNLITRNFNQDPLENFFSAIRSNGVRNINPTCQQFTNAFKTLIVNNFNSPHSARANCEKDDNNSMQSLINVLKRNVDDSQVDDFACEVDNVLALMFQMRNHESILHAESKKYVSGYIIKKCKAKIFKQCQTCTSDLCTSQVDLESFNYEMDYTKKSLFHPSDSFANLMNDVYFMTAACLRDFPQSTLLKKKIITLLNCACDYNIITCPNHRIQLIDLINDLAAKLIIHSWCKGVNRILDGKIGKFDGDDLIKKQAFDFYKNRSNKNVIK